MFLRAYRIVSPQFFDQELEKIFDIGKSLSYPRHFIENCLVKSRKIYYNPRPTAEIFDTFTNVLKLPYYCNFVDLPRFLRQLNINVVFTYDYTYKKLLITNIPLSD